ncbi:MAG: TRAP transporter small permease [Rhodobacteraceae bacterium]|nr:TRAP transporter small permease [Paracoccaceae bacterium]
MKTLYMQIGRGLDLLERGLMVLAVVAILMTSLLVLAEIGAREFLPFHVPDAVTIVAGLMVVSISFSLAHAMSVNAHIAVDLFYQHFPPSVQRLCDLIALVVGLGFSWAILYWSWFDVSKLYRRGSYYYGELQLPEWPVNSALLLGFAVLFARLVHLFAGRLLGLSATPLTHEETV